VASVVGWNIKRGAESTVSDTLHRKSGRMNDLESIMASGAIVEICREGDLSHLAQLAAELSIWYLIRPSGLRRI
jgi:hypothetical protein